ncbi:MAG: sarcosine oxidase subunit delta [Planctomycetota bacterium]|nr:sarcosine oxidase subunit delta [Planctomycetota bacterium]MDA1213205.1 sarcosine oxidase subunit delta [Planctomycetota bacterium]
MSLQLNCPNCGVRPVWEFHYGGPLKSRPTQDASAEAWTSYIYHKPNPRGDQKEWWYHRSACKLWFLAERNTQSNNVHTTQRFGAEESK